MKVVLVLGSCHIWISMRPSVVRTERLVPGRVIVAGSVGRCVLSIDAVFDSV